MKKVIIKTDGEQVATIELSDDVLPYSDMDQAQWNDPAEYFASTYAMCLSSLSGQVAKVTYGVYDGDECLGSGVVSHSAKRN